MKPERIVIGFYTLYILAIWLGSKIIDYSPLHIETIALGVTAILLMITGTYLGTRLSLDFRRPLLDLELRKTLPVAALLLTITMALAWIFIIRKHGSIAYIFAHAMDIRKESIGGAEDVIPIWITYPNSLIHMGYALALIPGIFRKKRHYLGVSIWFFLLIVLTDLQAFGRIATLHAIFVSVGMYLQCNGRLMTLRTAKLLGVVVLFYFILMLPRMIRGGFDNFESSVKQYKPHFTVDVPPQFNGMLSIFIYYFSSVYAFDEFLESEQGERWNGTRTFTPAVNIGARILGYERVNLIDDEAEIPFQYNIFTVARDFWSDFGLSGLLGGAFLAGIWFGVIGAQKGSIFLGLKAFSCGWLFYSPLYNAYSFGQFFIPFVVFFFFACFVRERRDAMGVPCLSMS